MISTKIILGANYQNFNITLWKNVCSIGQLRLQQP